MKYKYTLNISDPLSEEIVKLAPYTSLYLDDSFYIEHMGESKEKKSYPVTLRAFNIKWILGNEDNLGI